MAGDRAAETASCTTDDDSFSHGVEFVVVSSMIEDVCVRWYKVSVAALVGI
jgi:hypothetical protein